MLPPPYCQSNLALFQRVHGLEALDLRIGGLERRDAPHWPEHHSHRHGLGLGPLGGRTRRCHKEDRGLGAMRAYRRTEQAPSALMMLIQRQRPSWVLIHHSDRGSQFAAQACVDRLAVVGVVPSMSCTGKSYDQAMADATGSSPMARAPMERSSHLVRVESVHQHRCASRDKARRDLFGDIEGCCNRFASTRPSVITPEQAERNAS